MRKVSHLYKSVSTFDWQTDRKALPPYLQIDATNSSSSLFHFLIKSWHPGGYGRYDFLISVPQPTVSSKSANLSGGHILLLDRKAYLRHFFFLSFGSCAQFQVTKGL